MELTLIAMLDAMGGWDIVYRMGAAVAVAKLLIEGMGLVQKDLNAFLKISAAFIASAIVSLAWGGDWGIWARNMLVTFFMATFVWRDVIKRLIRKFGQNESD